MAKEKSGRELALGMLARREHGVEELWKKLMDKGVHGREAREIVNEFRDKKLVDDARYALARGRYRAVFSKWGAQRIRMELQQVGLEKELIEATLKRLVDDGDVVFIDEAEKAVRRRFRGGLSVADDALPKVDDGAAADAALGRRALLEARMKEKSKRIAYLVRRGYSFAEASEAVEAALAEGQG